MCFENSRYCCSMPKSNKYETQEIQISKKIPLIGSQKIYENLKQRSHNAANLQKLVKFLEKFLGKKDVSCAVFTLETL